MQQTSNKNNRNVQLILTLTFAVLAAAVFFYLDSKRNHNQQQHLQRVTARYESAYKIIYSQHKRMATTLRAGIMDRFKIADLYQKLVTANDEEKIRIRQELLTRVMPRYKMFQETIQLRQLHFHLRNNESFLRLHRPEKFGDNLTGIRDTVAYVNREQAPIDGFENGRIYDGYRFVFPITASDGVHLGSMEMSFGLESITAAMMGQYNVLCNFLIDETLIEAKTFPEEIRENYATSPFNGYLYDKKVLAELEKVSQKKLKDLKPCQETAVEMCTNAGKELAISVHDSSNDAVYTTIPVFHPLTNKTVAVFVTRSKSAFFTTQADHFKTVFFMGLLLLGMTSIAFYMQYNRRKALETTMTLLQRERDMFMQGSVMTFTWQNSENWPVEQVSSNVLTLLGYHADEFLDGSVLYAPLIHPDDQQMVMDKVTRIEGSKENCFTHEPYRLITRAGEIVWILDNTTVIRDKQNQITHFQGYLVDITTTVQLEGEKKAIEVTLQRNKKMQAIGLMAGGVAHDLNNILTGITGYPDIMLSKLPAESELRIPLSAIKESGERAAAVIADLLTVARGVASTMVSTNLNTLITEYFNSPEGRQVQTLYQQIHFQQILGKDLPGISCSSIHIKKCIMNLVINAAEAIDSSGTITVSTASVVPELQWAKENGLKQIQYILLTVADTGAGIPKKDIDHIFEPFYTKKVMGRSGTGLGLAVVWNTMEDHKGKIFVKSSEKGTCFQLYFPATAKEEAAHTDTTRLKPMGGNNEHILVVDDEPQLRDIASQMLQSMGYDVISVCSGEKAIQYVEQNPVDLLVIDMLMEPGMNGCQTYEQILEMYPGQKAVIASGFADSADVKTTLELGASGFIKKPYSMNQLGRTVVEALRNP